LKRDCRDEQIVVFLTTRPTKLSVKKSNDSALPAFWNQRYASAETPWVLHKTPATLRSFLNRTRAPGRVLIPGCGTDHGVIKAFADAGFEVTAIDFSTVALAETEESTREL
jgi:hypothetical protein